MECFQLWYPSQLDVPLLITGERSSLDVSLRKKAFHLILEILLVVFGVIFYHCGCFLEYKLKINDTARVVPVHGVW